MRNTINFLAICLMVSVFMLISCSKDGEIGPQGLQGEQGVAGPAGPQGPAGENAPSQNEESQDGSQGGGIVEGEQGDTGEQGPQGEQGETGERGPQGEQGPQGNPGEDGVDGEDGSVAIISSGWINASFTDGIMPVEDPLLTQDRVENSVIFVYGVWRDGDDAVWQFPHEIASGTIDHKKYDYFLTNDESSVGQYSIFFRVRDSDGNLTEARWITSVKYILIPEGNLTGKNSNLDLKKMSYEEVTEHFGLEF